MTIAFNYSSPNGTFDGNTDVSASASYTLAPAAQDSRLILGTVTGSIGEIKPREAVEAATGTSQVDDYVVQSLQVVGPPGILPLIAVADVADNKTREFVPPTEIEPGTYTTPPFMLPTGTVLRVLQVAAPPQAIALSVALVPLSAADHLAFVLGSLLPQLGQPAPAAFGQRNVGFVDPIEGDDATGTIGTPRPFKTIQGFIDAVPQGTDPTGARNVYVAQISPADYDEDLAIDISRRRIVLTGPGPWGLGTFGATDWGPSGTRRNIVVTGSDPNVDGIRPGLVIASNLPLSEGLTTHQSYLTRPRISGKIDASGASSIGSVELALACEIFGDGGLSIEAGTTILQSYLYRCRMREGLHGTNWQFQVAERSRFDGLIDVDNYSLIQSCRINAGMTIASSGYAGVRPNGILLTTFAGLYTGAAGTFNCDAYTNWWQKTNNPGGVTAAQKTVHGDLIP